MLSVVIITKNEESRIKACLESVKWADEIVVVDNGSSDSTLNIAEKYTNKIFNIKTEDFSQIRNFAMEKISSDWVLFVDADERVLETLKNEIKAQINSSQFSAYAISRRNVILGKEVKYSSFWPDWVVRLFKKSSFETWVGRVHEYPKFKGKLGYSKNSLLHLTHRNIDQMIMKSLEWSKIDAKLRFEANHPTMSGWRFLRIFISEIFNQGILRKGFFNGTIGTIDSIVQVFSMFITYVRLWEMQQSESLNKMYDNLDKELIKNNFKYS